MNRTTTSTRSETRYAVSADGTRIAHETAGTGPALVLVDGALCQRAFGPMRSLADALADRFAVTTYDRRGRGESGPGESAYDVAREVEDLAAVVDAVGGHVHVFGASSGASLALEAARRGVPIDRLVCYEAPYILDDTRAPNPPDVAESLRALVEDGRRGEAVKAFMTMVGAPRVMVAVMPLLPVWRKLTAVAHTLPYDLSFTVPFQQGRPLPEGHFAGVTAPTLVIAGGRSPAHLRNAQAAVADQLPAGRLLTLPGQTHLVKARVTAPVVAEHLGQVEG
jgi:pimeloyl-ACP methyl ester carboxylesterase